MTEYKQMTVEDWKAEIKASPTGCHRHIQNLLVKQAGGHPLSSSETNCLEAWSQIVKERVQS